MKVNRLGQSDLLISEIGLGCMSLQGEDMYAEKRIIQQAFAGGINYFDTADLYGFGANECLLGEAVADFRKDIIIATKVGNRWQEGKDAWTWDVSADYIYQAIEASLRRLNTDYIDLYQIHGGTSDDNFDEVVDTLEILNQQGKIREYGISSIRPNVFRKFAQNSAIVSNMMQYSMLDRRGEQYFNLFDQTNVSVISRGGFAQGILLKKNHNGYLDNSSEEVNSLILLVKEYATKIGISEEAVALSYILKNKVVASAVVGVSTSEQLSKLLHASKELLDYEIEIPIHLDHVMNYTQHL